MDDVASTIVCFLVQEGASIHIQNKKGNTPLDLCKPSLTALVTSSVARSGNYIAFIANSRIFFFFVIIVTLKDIMEVFVHLKNHLLFIQPRI